MARYSAKQIAQWFINRNAYLADLDKGDYITSLKLQKLLYYAQGLHLAIYDTPLFNDEIYAWDYGPVVKSVYYSYQNYQREPIKIVEEVDIDDNTAMFLDKVQQYYGKYSAYKLVEKTHREKPFKSTQKNDVILHSKIRDYFKSQISVFNKELSEEKKEELYMINILNRNLTAYKRLAK